MLCCPEMCSAKEISPFTLKFIPVLSLRSVLYSQHYCLPGSYSTCLNNAINWGPGIQIPDPMGDISPHLNHHKKQTNTHAHARTRTRECTYIECSHCCDQILDRNSSKGEGSILLMGSEVWVLHAQFHGLERPSWQQGYMTEGMVTSGQTESRVRGKERSQDLYPW